MFQKLVILCTFLFVASQGYVLRGKRSIETKADVCTGPFVELSVSPLIEDGYKRRITFDWANLPSGAEIGVFSTDPSQGSPTPLHTFTPSTSSGWGNTTIEEQHIEANKLSFKARCLGLYIAYRQNNGQWQGLSCLRTEPTWMADIRQQIQDKSLRDIFIPGTHDSSAYKEADLDNPDGLIMKYSVTQDESILGQLIYGARYIDLRPAHNALSPEEWFGNHGVVQFRPLREEFNDLKAFLDNTDEIVILDAHNFEAGFDNDDIHRKFIRFLEDQLQDYALPRSKFNYRTPLKDIWAQNKRLVIGYNYPSMLQESDILWPAVNQQWGDKQHLPDLVEYLTGVITKLAAEMMRNGRSFLEQAFSCKCPPSDEWSAMAQLTSTAQDILLDSMKGLRHAAEVVNHNMTSAFRKEEWAKNANIVAMDFIRGSGIVRAAIQWNSGQKPCSFTNATSTKLPSKESEGFFMNYLYRPISSVFKSWFH